MKAFKFFAVLLLSAGLYIASADVTADVTAGVIEVVLQDGLNGYDGCEDSYIYNSCSSSNYGTKTTMEMIYRYEAAR